jgi:hypothetical protein
MPISVWQYPDFGPVVMKASGDGICLRSLCSKSGRLIPLIRDAHSARADSRRGDGTLVPSRVSWFTTPWVVVRLAPGSELRLLTAPLMVLGWCGYPLSTTARLRSSGYNGLRRSVRQLTDCAPARSPGSSGQPRRQAPNIASKANGGRHATRLSQEHLQQRPW